MTERSRLNAEKSGVTNPSIGANGLAGAGLPPQPLGLPPDPWVTALRGLRSRAAIVGHCSARVAASPSVFVSTTSDGRREALVAQLRAARPVAWTEVLPPEIQGQANPDLDAVLHAFVLDASMNGGYFQAGPDGQPQQWAVGGSGSRALGEWLVALRTDRQVPGLDLQDPAVAEQAIGPRVRDLPSARERLQTACELADPARIAARRSLAADLTAARTLARAGGPPLVLDVALVDRLASLSPTGLGEDPFRKKAALVAVYLAGHFASEGTPTAVDLFVPADYQLPRVLIGQGLLTLAPAAWDALATPKLLAADEALVTDLRAATVVVADQLAQAARVDAPTVDNVLFLAGRAWMKTAAPEQVPSPMRVASFRF